LNPISSIFHRLGHKVLIPYITIGYPSIEATMQVVPLLAKTSCDIVELGIPFSDPLADGATIQNASFQALKNGVTTQRCLEVAMELSKTVKVPLIFMTYYNPVFSYGLEAFCRACASSGVSGLIIPDLPPEEASELALLSLKWHIDLIYLLSPTSTEERIRIVARESKGFIYLVSVSGVTGTRATLPIDLESFVTRVRSIADQPLCVGFGISTSEQARHVANIADGVIVGSRIIQIMESDNNLESLTNFIVGLRQALNEPNR
jgi:tryptophan synthase alpha chain